MIRSNSRSHASTLEKSRIALDKAESNPAIAKALKKIGYGPEKIKEGKALVESTREIFDRNLKKQDEYSTIRDEFNKQKAALDRTFREHRRRALLIFRNEPSLQDMLAISGPYPREFIVWAETVKKFYTEIVSKPELQERFQQLNFTKEEAEKGLEMDANLDRLYAKRMELKGVSKLSTAQKNKAFEKLDDWMTDFYGAARLILRKEPKLLEILYKSA